MHRSNLRSERVTATMDEKTKSSLPMFHCVSSAVPRHVTSAGITQRFGSLTEYPGDCLRTKVATEPRPFPVLRGLFCVFFVSCPCLLFLLFFLSLSLVYFYKSRARLPRRRGARRVRACQSY